MVPGGSMPLVDWRIDHHHVAGTRMCGACMQPFEAKRGSAPFTADPDDREPCTALCDGCAELLDPDRYERLQAGRARPYAQPLRWPKVRL